MYGNAPSPPTFLDKPRDLWLNRLPMTGKGASPSEVDRDSGSLVDHGVRAAYRVAHRMLRAYWSVRKPHTRGALVAVWCEGRVLIVKNSYRREYTLPGGYRRSDETVPAAGARELREECGIDLDPAGLEVVYSAVKPFEHRNDEVTIAEVTVADRPAILIDRREVVWAGFETPEAVLGRPIVPHLRDYLEQRASR